VTSSVRYAAASRHNQTLQHIVKQVAGREMTWWYSWLFILIQFEFADAMIHLVIEMGVQQVVHVKP
jgi:hypothetical protein